MNARRLVTVAVAAVVALVPTVCTLDVVRPARCGSDAECALLYVAEGERGEPGYGVTPDKIAKARAFLRIEEDDPRWDCRTMGNRVCGAVLEIDYI